jgi:predicted metal-dependent HD superfamily phosphohydrolase
MARTEGNPWEQEWADVCWYLGARDEEAIARNWVVLEALYKYPKRAYHNMGHVTACMLACRFGRRAITPEQVTVAQFALFVHDCIYDSRRHDNEARSAAVGAMLARDLGIAQVHTGTIVRLVMATTHRGEPADAHEAFVRDVDLYSLAADEPLFDATTRAIRDEFRWASEEQFRAGRLAFFRQMLARPTIYFLPEYRDLCEAAARANLERAIRQMDAEGGS